LDKATRDSHKWRVPQRIFAPEKDVPLSQTDAWPLAQLGMGAVLEK
jgi:hypothetical protein